MVNIFDHGLGHGIGVEIHEEPYQNATSQTILQPELAKGTPIENGLPPASLAMGILSLIASSGLVGFILNRKITGFIGIKEI
ncbi:hypothetical protein FQA39_LY12901 [Lamprigera yunnana]|nr:hypothetical protein FQA39_LY12901 [Lamprigera yunnana]